MFSLHSHVSSGIANISAHFFLCSIQQMGASHSLHLLELTKREAQFCVFCTDFLTLSSPQPYEVILFFFIITSASQVKTLRYREVKELVYRHKANFMEPELELRQKTPDSIPRTPCVMLCLWNSTCFQWNSHPAWHQ